jgi:hypothetical protein
MSPDQLNAYKKPRICGAFEAAEGTRTLDLLHGKRRQGKMDHDRIVIWPAVPGFSSSGLMQS